ncbi:MAG: hypothetical protein ACRDL1_05850, partial [Solirubrobacterales bacterium]
MNGGRRHLLLVNPTAGGGRALKLLPEVERALAARDDSGRGVGWVRDSRLRLEPNRHLLLRMRGLLVAQETPAAGLTWRSPMLGEGVAANAIRSAADRRLNTMPGAVGDLLHTVRDGAPAPEGRLPVSDGSVPDPLSPDGALDYRFSMGPRRTLNGEPLQAVEFTS